MRIIDMKTCGYVILGILLGVLGLHMWTDHMVIHAMQTTLGQMQVDQQGFVRLPVNVPVSPTTTTTLPKDS